MSLTLSLIKESEARWIDLRFTDTKGKEQHVSIPSSEVNDDFFQVIEVVLFFSQKAQ
jgi:glutamine synthetase